MNNLPQILFDFDDRQWTIEIIRTAFKDLQQNINHKVCPHSLKVQNDNLFTYEITQCQCQLNDKTIDRSKLDILRYLLSRSNDLNRDQRLAIFNGQLLNQQNINIGNTQIHFFDRRNFYLQQILKLKKLNDTYAFRYIIFNYSEKFANFHLILIRNRNELEFKNYTQLIFNLKHFLIFIQLAVLNNITIQINQTGLQIGDISEEQNLHTIQIYIDEENERNRYNDQFINLGKLLNKLILQLEVQENTHKQLITLNILSEYLIAGNIKSLNYVIQFLDNEGFQNFQSPMFIDTDYTGLQQLYYIRLRYKIYFIYKTLEYCRLFLFVNQMGNPQINYGFNYILYTILDQTIREFLMLFPDELLQFTYEVHFHIYQYIQFCTMNQLDLNKIQQIQYYQAQQTMILGYLNQNVPQNNLQFQQIKLRLKLLLSGNFDYYLRVLYFTINDPPFNFCRQQIENQDQILQNPDIETILHLIQLIDELP